MAALRKSWSEAKKAFANGKLNTADVPPEFLLDFTNGADFGPALDKLEKASSYEDRRKAIVPVLEAKEYYLRITNKGLRRVEVKDVEVAMVGLRTAVLDIWTKAEKLTQPPRPSGSDVKYQVLRGISLGRTYKPKYLSLDVTKVDVFVEVDATLDQLIKDGAESLKIAHLGEVAMTEINKVEKAFADTLRDLDATIGGLALDEKARTAKIREANEVLKHYAGIVADRSNAAVQEEWKGYLARRAYLKEFRIKCTAKVVLGTIGVGVAIASAVLTFGALWMNVIAAVKGTAEVALTIKTWAEDLETVAGKLADDMDRIDALNAQREKAKGAGKGQKASKGKEASKEVLAAILPVTKVMMKTTSDTESRAKQMLALVSKVEDQADVLVKQINAALAALKRMPPVVSKELADAAAEIEKTLNKALGEVPPLHRGSQVLARYGHKALAATQKLRKEDSWFWDIDAEKTTGCGTKGVALYALANFAYSCAHAGKALIPI